MKMLVNKVGPPLGPGDFHVYTQWFDRNDELNEYRFSCTQLEEVEDGSAD